MDKIVIYQTLADFFRSIGLSLKNNEEITVLDLEGLHGEEPMHSPPFRTNYYVFILIEEGSGSYRIDDHEFKLTPFSLYFTNPGHLKSFNIQKSTSDNAKPASKIPASLAVKKNLYDQNKQTRHYRLMCFEKLN